MGDVRKGTHLDKYGCEAHFSDVPRWLVARNLLKLNYKATEKWLGGAVIAPAR